VERAKRQILCLFDESQRRESALAEESVNGELTFNRRSRGKHSSKQDAGKSAEEILRR